MKKIMCVAALVAGVAMNGYPIESGNVVGYLNKAKTPGAMNLITPCFTALNGSGKIKLSDLKIVGYKDADGNYLKGWSGLSSGINKAAVIAKINGNGATLRQKVNGGDNIENVEYYWYDTTTKLAGWYDAKGNPMTADGNSWWGDASLIKFGAADGFRVKISAFYMADDEFEEGPTLPMSLKFPGCL